MNNSSVKLETQNNSNTNGSTQNLNNGSANTNGNSKNSNAPTNNKANLIVNYLPQSLKEHDFNQLFSKIGPLKSCKLMFDRQTGYSFGYGFVEYVNEDDARKAIETLNGYQIEHKRLKVALARPNCEETKNTNLYIRNIPANYDESQLHELFSQYGEVIQVRLLRDQNTAFSRRIGFVIMATKQMAQLAIQNLDNTVPPNGGNEPIYVKYADEDGKKKHSSSGGVNSRNNHHNSNHHHHHQNNYSNNFSNLNYMNQQAGFGYNNNFMMNSAGQNSMPSGSSFPNLGKMKSNRSGVHQNRYNPLAGNNAQAGLASGVLSQPGNTGNANNYSNWNMAQGMQTAYNSFGTPNHLIGNSAGFDNIIGGSAAGAGTTSAYSNHHHNIHNHPMQQHNPNNYLNINTAAMVAAVANLGGSSSNGNLLDLSGGGSLGVDNKLSGSAGNNMASGTTSNVIYVYGIGPQATESDLYSLFSNCGRIARVNVIKNPKTTQCKGYGFVMFETYEEAYYAVHSMNGYMYNNRPLQVSIKSLTSYLNLKHKNNNKTNDQNEFNKFNKLSIHFKTTKDKAKISSSG